MPCGGTSGHVTPRIRGSTTPSASSKRRCRMVGAHLEPADNARPDTLGRSTASASSKCRARRASSRDITRCSNTHTHVERAVRFGPTRQGDNPGRLASAKARVRCSPVAPRHRERPRRHRLIGATPANGFLDRMLAIASAPTCNTHRMARMPAMSVHGVVPGPLLRHRAASVRCRQQRRYGQSKAADSQVQSPASPACARR